MGSRNNRALLLLGAAAGVAAGYFLSTEKGKQFQKDASATAKKYGTQIQDQSKDGLAQTSNALNSLVDKGMSQFNVLQRKAKEAVDEIATNLQETAKDATRQLNTTKDKMEDHFAHTENNRKPTNV